jgi:hypothetical protein
MQISTDGNLIYISIHIQCDNIHNLPYRMSGNNLLKIRKIATKDAQTFIFVYDGYFIQLFVDFLRSFLP